MFDTIIVGGGSAGCVLAHRLSARSSHRVLLCEAGMDLPPGRIPADIADSYWVPVHLNAAYFWNELQVTTRAPTGNENVKPALRRYEQARVLGGGSSVNGQMANRGSPRDYDEWEELGASGWNWESVLPYFRRIERDMDFDGPYHGREGRIPVTRVFPEQWCGHAKAIAEAFEAAGYEYLPDQNGEFRDGYFALVMSNVYDRRVSAAVGYLDGITRQRKNLTISTSTTVTELLFENRRCVGVKAMVNGREQEFRGNEIILSSGAIHTPAHLLRAGIGPEAELKPHGITVLSNLPGVGRRLMDHPAVVVSAFVERSARINGLTRRHGVVGLRYSSEIGDAPQGDMFMACMNKSTWHAVGDQIGSFLVFVNKPFSATGEVKLKSRDWRAEPEVNFNLLSDWRDVQRLLDGVRRAAKFHEAPALSAIAADPFPAYYSERMRRYTAMTRKNRIYTRILAALLEGPDSFRRALIRNLIVEKYDMDSVMNDDKVGEAFVREAATGIWHASCTCRMGADNDPMAVTDTWGRVRGIGGLRIVDASIFPSIPCANTNFPVMMAAERIADGIDRGH